MGLLAPELGRWAEVEEQGPELSQAGVEAKVENCRGGSADQGLLEESAALFFSPFHLRAEDCLCTESP